MYLRIGFGFIASRRRHPSEIPKAAQVRLLLHKLSINLRTYINRLPDLCFLLCSLTCPSAFLGLMLSAQVSPTDGIAGSMIRSEFQQIEIYKILNIMIYYNHTKNVYL